MNDYAHLQLHEATIRESGRSTRHQHPARRLARRTKRRTWSRTRKGRAGAAAAGRASAVRTA